MADQEENMEPAGSRHITGRESVYLWVRSGGRCARCNKYLLEDEYTEYPINLGERAHIAGWKQSAGSPRSESLVPVSERNRADNLVLLCMACHKMIDDPAKWDEFSEEFLLDLKHAHEDRIRHLTAMAKDRETTVIRVFGSIRGSVPELARDQAMQTVIDGAGRYASFPLAIDRHGIEVNLAPFRDPEETGEDTYWRLGKAEIDKVVARVREGVHEKHIRHISLFALARIPLLVYLGYALDDKVPVDLYQKHRGEDEGWIWPKDGGTTKDFEVIHHRDGDAGSDVCLILSLSGTIQPEELPTHTETMTLLEIRPVGDTPNPSLFRSRATLDSFAHVYRGLLSELERTHKSAPAMHLFLAAPVTAAIVCGRSLMRDAHPSLVIYDRIGDEHRKAITVNERGSL